MKNQYEELLKAAREVIKEVGNNIDASNKPAKIALGNLYIAILMIEREK